jgi:hypothetical protein
MVCGDAGGQTMLAAFGMERRNSHLYKNGAALASQFMHKILMPYTSPSTVDPLTSSGAENGAHGAHVVVQLAIVSMRLSLTTSAVALTKTVRRSVTGSISLYDCLFSCYCCFVLLLCRVCIE